MKLLSTPTYLALGLAAGAVGAGLALRRQRRRSAHHTLWSDCGEQVRDGAPCWQAHPRPQFRRALWQSLNQGWRLNGSPIRLPFPPQAPLSGFEGRIGTHLTYETEFFFPHHFTLPKVVLHFGAVDQVARVELNGVLLGSHEGGYLPFCFDITQHIRRNGPNRLVVYAQDPLSIDYPYGKQRKKRGGMWYTPVSGIWQTVWLENLPSTHLGGLTITPDLTGAELKAEGWEGNFSVTVELGEGRQLTRDFPTCSGRLDIPEPILWTPDRPHLYPITVTAGQDRVESYFALRTIAVEQVDGVNRVCLNGSPIFLHGVLDQGYFCDGLYLPAQEEEYERDILRMKQLGFNLLRKHIKVEPECFYYACDRLGMLVMQDMVNSGPYHFLRQTGLPNLGFKTARDNTGMTGKRKEFFLAHSRDTIRHLYNHPCIVAYTIFNEGWGQFESDQVYRMVKQWDPTRLADSTSGWFAQKENDFDSEHIYFKVIPLTPGVRPLFVSECGGYTLLCPHHHYSKYARYGYGTCQDPHELTQKIDGMYRTMILPAIPAGLCGCVFTQLSDVEDEINGLYTYDRKVCKPEAETMRKLAKELMDSVGN